MKSDDDIYNQNLQNIAANAISKLLLKGTGV